MRYSIRKLLIGVTVVALFAALIGGAVRTVTQSYNSIRDFYAIDQTRMMLIDYILANDGNWPSSWEDLKPYFGKYKNHGWSENIDSLSTLVEVDFSFSPNLFLKNERLMQTSVPKLVSVKARRREVEWKELDEVNRRLIAVLRKKHAAE